MRFRWWMAPVIGVGICATANGVLIATSFRVRPQKVVERPYAASAHEDQRAAERAVFTARGWRLTTAVDGSGCTLTLASIGGVQPVAGRVQLYRPDDLAADRELAWTDLAQPLRCDLPRPGAWSVRVVLQDGAGVVLVDDLRLNRP
jgi:nitrogen fixation protein FixH